MNCEDFNHALLDIARDQILEAGARTGAMAHVSSCGRCRVRLEDEQQLSRRMRALAKAMGSLNAAPQLSPRVIAMFRDQSRVFEFPQKTRRWKSWAAAAAIVLLAIGLTVQLRKVFSTPNGSVVSVPPSNIQAGQPEKTQGVELGLPLKSPATFVKHKPRTIPDPSVASRSLNTRGERSPRPDTGNTKSEIATDFFAVGDTSASSLADGGQLVRVELPRSALMRFGLPVNNERANERVKADVLVGSDGIARAVRFIR